MATIEIKKKFEFSDEELSDLLVTAFEGGINYWCGRVGFRKPGLFKGMLASDALPKGAELVLYDAETPDKWELTLEKFLSGLKRVIEEDDCGSVEDFMDNHDALTADRIIQYALFNEQVFA